MGFPLTGTGFDELSAHVASSAEEQERKRAWGKQWPVQRGQLEDGLEFL